MAEVPAHQIDDTGPRSTDRVVEHPAWPELKNAVERIRHWQSKDGSIDLDAPDAPDHGLVVEAVDRVIAAVDALSPLLPYDAPYHTALINDLRTWSKNSFGVPDFLDSLLAFQPAANRVDGLQHLTVFPMYTQNGNPDRNLEAVVLRMVWPDWLAELERTRYGNPMYCGVAFEDFTPGYDTDSAVFFPETVAVRETPDRFSWAGIFCDREAARYRLVVSAAADILRLELPDEAQRMIVDQDRCVEAFTLWDMIHDRGHSHGPLPFDPFMIKQRHPFWMYGLEELRCDLNAFREGVRLEAEGITQGRDVQLVMLFDRILRFPVTGGRERNYDSLGGQLLFARLHQHAALSWSDNTLSIDWARVPEVVDGLRAEIEELYRAGIDRPKLVHWLAGHRLVSRCLAPHPASRWAGGAGELDLTRPPRELLAEVLPDEFPLSVFYETLARKLKHVIASTRGITAARADALTRSATGASGAAG
ncbi:DUF6421 family protein [Streptomyces jumonjinensis]|uniref:DUF6421 family protein n=1 Tax=Streptomyces jumonjinensis TaxID=1945 RepID=UPI0037B3F15B